MSTHTDERPNARAGAQRMGFVSRPRFEDYREKYATYFKLERQNGILQVYSMATKCSISPRVWQHRPAP